MNERVPGDTRPLMEWGRPLFSFLPKKPRMIRGFSVPGVGIEPTLLAEREFESRASTNSATRASLTGGGQK